MTIKGPMTWAGFPPDGQRACVYEFVYVCEGERERERERDTNSGAKSIVHGCTLNKKQFIMSH